MKRGLFLLIGESFRTGFAPGVKARRRGDPESFPLQMEATNSHLHFFEHLQQKHSITPHVSLVTYSSCYDKHLIEKYEPYLVNHRILDNLIGIGNLFKESLKNVDLDSYDFICYIRIDLYLKHKFFEVFDPNWSSIRFVTVCFKFNNYHIHRGKPRVSDMMLFVPKPLYSYCIARDLIAHEGWYTLTNELGVSEDHIDTMIDTYHDSNTYDDWNPLFYIVNRPASLVWRTPNERFNKLSFP